MTTAETDWWTSLTGDDIRLNTEGDPPYDAGRVAALILGRLHLGGRVLDVGCGTGRLTALYDLISGSELVGFDPSPQILAAARERVPGVRFVEALPDGPFAGAYCVTVLQHLTHDVSAGLVADVISRLRPGGRFVFQYVEGTENTFLSHQATETVVRDWCRGFDVTFEPDPVYGEWRWVTVQR